MEIIPYARQWIDEDDVAAVAETLRSNFVTQGPAVGAFEKALAERFGVRRAVVCSNGTAALHLAYVAMGVDGRSVGITTPVTFAATANAFRHLGARVAFCDIDPATGLVDPESLEDSLGSVETDPGAVNLITPVSFAGSLAPLRKTASLANLSGFEVLEDASHSPGAWHGEGDGRDHSAECVHTRAAILSFHPVKHICCGEGGAVLTNDEELVERMTHLRAHGIRRPFADSPTEKGPAWFYEQTALGYNYRLTDIQAALGLSQLRKLDSFLARRRELAERYRKALGEALFTDLLDPPPAEPGHAWHIFVVRFRQEGLRDRAHEFLKDRGILTQVHYVPLYRHPYYRELLGEIRLPGAEAFYQGCLSLPLFPKMSDADQERVLEALANFAKETAQ